MTLTRMEEALGLGSKVNGAGIELTLHKRTFPDNHDSSAYGSFKWITETRALESPACPERIYLLP